MKVYYGKKGLLLLGKVWEVREKLEDCTKDYRFVQEMIQDHHKCTPAFAKKYGT